MIHVFVRPSQQRHPLRRLNIPLGPLAISANLVAMMNEEFMIQCILIGGEGDNDKECCVCGRTLALLGAASHRFGASATTARKGVYCHFSASVHATIFV